MKELNIYQRINAVMKEVTYVQKESRKVNNMYTFCSHDSVTSALHVPMTIHGIAMIPSIVELTQDGNKTIVKMEVAFINIDKPEEQVKVIYYGYGIDPSDKGIGKAVSYAVKYAMLKTFCLETGDDVERDNIEHIPSQKKEESVDYPELLKLELGKISQGCNKNEKSYVVAYLKALEKEFMDRGGNWEEPFYKALIKLNGEVKNRALNWSIDQMPKA